MTCKSHESGSSGHDNGNFDEYEGENYGGIISFYIVFLSFG